MSAQNQDDPAQDPKGALEVTLRALARQLDSLVDALDLRGGPDLDVELADGKIVLEFEDGVKFIINRQSGNDQLWLAEPMRGWHYEWNGEAWICDSRGLEFYATFEALLAEKLGVPVDLRAGEPLG